MYNICCCLSPQNVVMELNTSIRDTENFKPVELSHILHMQLSETVRYIIHIFIRVLYEVIKIINILFLRMRPKSDFICRTSCIMKIQGISWRLCKKSFLIDVVLCCMTPCIDVRLPPRLKDLDLLKAPLAEGKMLARNQTQEAHIAAAITWWRGQNKEAKTSQTGREPHETVNQTDRKTAHLEETACGVKVVLKDCQVQAEETWKNEFRDAAVLTDSIVDAGEAEHVATEGLLEALRRVENIVTQALKAAQVLMDDEKMIKERIEAINQRVEKALSRAAVTENQLNALEATVSASTQVTECFYSNLNSTVCKHHQML